MKISEITIDSVKEYCGISSNDSDVILTACLASAKAYAVGFTGCALAELEEYEDVSLAIMMLANDYFLFRFSGQGNDGQGNDKPNPAVENILHMHCKNFL